MHKKHCLASRYLCPLDRLSCRILGTTDPRLFAGDGTRSLGVLQRERGSERLLRFLPALLGETLCSAAVCEAGDRGARPIDLRALFCVSRMTLGTSRRARLRCCCCRLCFCLLDLVCLLGIWCGGMQFPCIRCLLLVYLLLPHRSQCRTNRTN